MPRRTRSGRPRRRPADRGPLNRGRAGGGHRPVATSRERSDRRWPRSPARSAAPSASWCRSPGAARSTPGWRRGRSRRRRGARAADRLRSPRRRGPDRRTHRPRHQGPGVRRHRRRPPRRRSRTSPPPDVRRSTSCSLAPPSGSPSSTDPLRPTRPVCAAGNRVVAMVDAGFRQDMRAMTDARAAIEALQGHEAWAIIRRSTRAGDRDTVGLVGGRRSVVESILDVPLEDGVPDGRAHRRPAAGDPVPAGRRARLRGPRRRHPAGRGRHRDRAGVLRRRGDRRDRPTTGIEFTDRGGFETDDEDVRQARRGDHRATRSARARAPTSSSAGTTARRSPTGTPTRRSTVFRRLLRARARRLLDLLLLHRRPLPDRRQPRAARQRATASDVRMNPISGTFRLAGDDDPAERKAAAAGLPAPTRRRSTSSSWSSTRS